MATAVRSTGAGLALRLALRLVAVCLAAVSAEDLPLPWHFADTLNSSLHAKFFVLRPPRELRRLQGQDFECEYFGHMYSFEFMYPDFFELNGQFLAATPEEADFVVLEHCVTYAYHVLRYGAGYNTVKLTWEALRIVQESYLLPIIHWAESTPAYQKFQGRNFVIVFAMDKGRADYPIASRATQHWHAITTVGNGTTWMKRHEPYLLLESTAPDPCRGRSSTSKRRLIYYEQDVVAPVPTGFEWTEASEQVEDRHLLLFYAASPNSCIRRHISRELAESADAEVDAIWGVLCFVLVCAWRLRMASESTSEVLAPELPAFESWEDMPKFPMLYDVKPVGPPVPLSFGCWISLSVLALGKLFEPLGEDLDELGERWSKRSSRPLYDDEGPEESGPDESGTQ